MRARTERANPVDARIGPDVEKDDFPAQLGGRQRRRIEPCGRAGQERHGAFDRAIRSHRQRSRHGAGGPVRPAVLASRSLTSPYGSDCRLPGAGEGGGHAAASSVGVHVEHRYRKNGRHVDDAELAGQRWEAMRYLRRNGGHGSSRRPSSSPASSDSLAECNETPPVASRLLDDGIANPRTTMSDVLGERSRCVHGAAVAVHRAPGRKVSGNANRARLEGSHAHGRPSSGAHRRRDEGRPGFDDAGRELRGVATACMLAEWIAHSAVRNGTAPALSVTRCLPSNRYSLALDDVYDLFAELPDQ